MKDQRLTLNIIDTLPPPIIESVLCLIPLKEAVRTCILSKEWRYSWTKVPKVVFNDDTVQLSANEIQLPDRNQIKTLKLLNAINQVMSLRQGPILDFTLDMDVDDNDTRLEVGRILTHLLRNNMLDRLSIDLTHGCRLPLEVFSLHMLTDLYLRNCNIDHLPVFGGFRRLTRFCLHDVNIYPKTLLLLLSNCPLLKTFTLLLCQDNIRSQTSHERPTMIELFECLPRIEHFTSWGWLTWCFSEDPVPRELPTSLVHLKSLILSTMCFLDELVYPFLIMLMRSSPNLEKLKIEVMPNALDGHWEDDLDYVTKRRYSDVWLEHLNDFEIGGFSYLKPEMDFVKLILVKSPVLKKARIILYHDDAEDDELLSLTTTFLRSPHAATEVEITVENRLEHED